MLNVRQLTIQRDTNTIISQLSFRVEPGSITFIVGRSGTGKSTLLEAITQLIPYEGTISYQNKDLKEFSLQERAKILGIVFQQWYLFPHLTVLENCTHPLQIVKGLSLKNAQKEALELLNRFDINRLNNAYPATLSGGQKQRVALARAVSLQPKLLCLDEPTSALDADNKEIIITYLKEMNAQGTTMIITSHDQSFIEALAERTIHLI